MNRQFIEATMQVATYQHKQGTETSFYRQEGSTILPNRISYSIGAEITEAQHKGRMLNKEERVIGEIKGIFTKVEVSPLKQNKPFAIHSKIFKTIDYPQLTGYAILAISNEEGRSKQEEGMLVIHQISSEVLKLFYMQGVTCNPSDKLLVCEVALSMI